MSERADRVIFLDVDGVFNSMSSIIAYGTSTMFDDVALQLVQRLCKESHAKVVLSSAWRIGRDLTACREIFRERRALDLADRVIDKTVSGFGVRGEEIAAWLRTHGPCDYAIIDDDSDMLDSQKPRFVQTHFATGFRIPEYVAVLRLFEPDHEDCRLLAGYRPTPRLEWEPTP